MRLQYIFTYLRTGLPLAAFVACLWLACGCTDELNAPEGTDVAEGLPAVVTLKLDLGEMTPISRADIPDEQANRVTSLWVAVYNVKTGLRTGLYISDDDEEFTKFHEYKELNLTTFSGESYIVATANYKMRYATSGPGETPIPLPDALAAADTWEKYCKLAVFFDEDGKTYFEAPVDALVMNGYYTVHNKDNEHAANSKPEMKTLTITEGMNKPSGAIHLRRMISQVKFRIKYNSKNINTFEITNWSVENLPTNSWLHERPDDYASAATYGEALNSFDTRKVRTGFNSSGKQIVVNTVEEGKDIVSVFDFCQLENRRTGNEAATDYRSREKEYKNDDGTNSGKFVALVDGKDSTDPNNNATYITFHVVMEMNVDENGNDLSTTAIKRRIVETDYVVHLGYVNKDPKDFDCRRNSKYTYNVMINNVDDVIVESKVEENIDKERTPGVEGFVSDVTDSYYELDAHYCAVNVNLTAADLRDFNYYISATRLNGTDIIIDSQDPNCHIPEEGEEDYKYLSWIEFRETSGANVLSEYKPASDSKTYTLPEMKANANSLKAGWYTVFVNEYVYENDGALGGNESSSTNWKNYVNRPARNMWLIVQTKTSKDKESLYYESKYGVSQQSIQCYYHVDNPNYKSAIGVEHTNETFGLTLRNNFNYQGGGTGTSEIAGRYNLLQFINSQKENSRLNWSTYLSLKEYEYVPAVNNQGYSAAASNKPLPKIQRVSFDEINYVHSSYEPNSTDRIQAINACMNRNRDLNGDGKIDYGELRWFVPSSNQAVRLILGRQALEDPLLNPKGVTQLSYPSQNGFNTRFMFYTSDGKNLWAMEGTSLSTYREWPASMSTPWEIRCVRNLGSDMTVIENKRANEPAFIVDTDNNIVDLSGFDDKCLRQQPYTDGYMPIHHVNDQTYNRPYIKFEYQDVVVSLSDERIKDQQKAGESWSDYISRTNPCSFYNTNTKKGWRVPNQKEAAIMGLYQKNDKGFDANDRTFYNTCTVSYFDISGYAYGSNPSNDKLDFDLHAVVRIRTSDGGGTIGDDSSTKGIRCVRDIVE